MASVERLYCGAVKCSEKDEPSVRRYCKNNIKQITKGQKVQLPQSSQIPPDFLLGYTKTEMGGNRKGTGCGFRTLYTKNQGWSGWGTPSPSATSAPSAPSALSAPSFTKSILFTKGTGTGANDDATINMYEMVVRVLEDNKTIRTLTKDDYLPNPMCDDGLNVGYCKMYPASNAIDGIINNLVSTNRDSPKLLFVLKDAKLVVDVTVYNRDAHLDRFNGVKLSLLNSSNVPIKECMLIAGPSYTCKYRDII